MPPIRAPVGSSRRDDHADALHERPAPAWVSISLSHVRTSERAQAYSLSVLPVSKGWAAWPWWVRGLTVITAVVFGLAIAWVLLVPVADWLAHHDVGSVKGPLHETATDNARGRLLTLAAGVAAAGALIFTARNSPCHGAHSN